jgi:hypothetical protein
LLDGLRPSAIRVDCAKAGAQDDAALSEFGFSSEQSLIRRVDQLSQQTGQIPAFSRAPFGKHFVEQPVAGRADGLHHLGLHMHPAQTIPAIAFNDEMLNSEGRLADPATDFAPYTESVQAAMRELPVLLAEPQTSNEGSQLGTTTP